MHLQVQNSPWVQPITVMAGSDSKCDFLSRIHLLPFYRRLTVRANSEGIKAHTPADCGKPRGGCCIWDAFFISPHPPPSPPDQYCMKGGTALSVFHCSKFDPKCGRREGVLRRPPKNPDTHLGSERACDCFHPICNWPGRLLLAWQEWGLFCLQVHIGSVAAVCDSVCIFFSHWGAPINCLQLQSNRETEGEREKVFKYLSCNIQDTEM